MVAALVGRICTITALQPTCFNWSRRRTNCSCCSIDGKPGLDGQSILATVAIHAALNSRFDGWAWIVVAQASNMSMTEIILFIRYSRMTKKANPFTD